MGVVNLNSPAVYPLRKFLSTLVKLSNRQNNLAIPSPKLDCDAFRKGDSPSRPYMTFKNIL